MMGQDKRKDTPVAKPTIAGGEWLLILEEGTKWAPPEGATLRQYDSESAAKIRAGSSPEMFFSLAVAEVPLPSARAIDINALHERILMLASQDPEGILDASVLLLDEWLTSSKEEGLPKAWRSDVLRVEARQGAILEILQAVEVNIQVERGITSEEDIEDFFLDAIQLIMTICTGTAENDVDSESRLGKILLHLWPEGDARRTLVSFV